MSQVSAITVRMLVLGKLHDAITELTLGVVPEANRAERRRGGDIACDKNVVKTPSYASTRQVISIIKGRDPRG